MKINNTTENDTEPAIKIRSKYLFLSEVLGFQKLRLYSLNVN